jgi:hypothetical protein
VSYIYSAPWFGGRKPWFSLNGLAELSFGYNGVFAADVVVAHAPSLLGRGYHDHVVQLRRNAPHSQIWLLETAESAVNYPAQFEPAFRGLFDAEISFRQTADIWTPYIHPDQFTGYQDAATSNRSELCCAFISSGVNKSHRCEYMAALMQHMEVASFGRFMKNRVLDDDRGTESKLAAMRNFRYTLSFENAIEPDYVTEKFFEPFIAGTIPIYLGAPNVEEFAPGEDCYIDARQFPEPAALATFIRNVDPSRFHRWRKAPLRPRFQDMLKQTYAPFDSSFMALVGSLRGIRQQDMNTQPYRSRTD